MLLSLQVRDFAIVDDLILELGSGMTVLSGETGAGKSLLVDALNLAIGERASQDAIREGADQAEVNAVFDPPPEARAWLGEHELDESDGSCMLRRMVGRDGRSRAFINGRPVPVSRLKALGERLVDVHGQHAHQSLLKPVAQREVLDTFGGHEAGLTRLKALHGQLSELRSDIASLTQGEDPLARADYLRFQISELAPFETDGRRPAQQLEAHRRLAHAADLIALLERAHGQLDEGEGSVDQGLGNAIRAIEAAAQIDPELAGLCEPLQQARTLVAEVSAGVATAARDMDADPRRLDELERELGTLQDLARKHRVEMEGLLERLEALRLELHELENARDTLDALQERLQHTRLSYMQAAQAMSEARTKAARKLAAAVNAGLCELGMNDARVEFQVFQSDEPETSAHGIDSVRLLVRTNPGQPFLPLARVASGGELSRIALAIQSITSDGHGVPCVIFDEVDVGVGGAVAEVVGRRMRTLAGNKQVLTVTHQPQVAALAHCHIRVMKTTSRGNVRTQLQTLDAQPRIEEVARMLGGVTLTKRTLEHAREMIQAADEPCPAPRTRPRSRSRAS